MFDADKATVVMLGDNAAATTTGDRIMDEFTFRLLHDALLSLPRVQLLLFGVGAKFRLRCDDALCETATMTIDGVNDDACSLTGRSASELVGSPASTVLQCRRIARTVFPDLPDCVQTMTAECRLLRVATPVGQQRVHVVGHVELSPSPLTSYMHLRAMTMTVLNIFAHTEPQDAVF